MSVIAGANQGTLRGSLYKKLRLESLQSRRWYRKVVVFYKILNGLTPKHLLDIISVSSGSCYNTRALSKSELTQFYSAAKSYSSTFFPLCIKEWNKLDAKIRNLTFTEICLAALTNQPIKFQIQKIAFYLFQNRWKFNFWCS